MNSVGSKKPSDVESALSIMKDPERRSKICSVVPKVKLAPLRTKTEIAVIRGPPSDESGQAYGDDAFARTVSTYPRNQTTGKRDGDPICDQYYLVLYENRILFALGKICLVKRKF
jgi:hypothetical protein